MDSTAHVRTPAKTLPAPISRITVLVARHPLAAFLVMAYTVMWLSLLPALLLDAPIRPLTVLGAVGGLALPAVLVTAATSGTAGVRDLARRCLRWRVSPTWYLLALFCLPVGMVVGAMVFFGGSPLQALVDIWPLLVSVFLPEVLIALVTIQMWEEAGWMGFVQHRLQDRQGPWRASLVTALAFALIHLPTYFIGVSLTAERVSLSLAMMLPIIIFAAFFRVFMMWLYNGAGSSALIVAVFHAAFNTASGTRFTAELIPGPQAAWLPLAVVAVLALLVTVVTKGRLGYRQLHDGQ